MICNSVQQSLAPKFAKCLYIFVFLLVILNFCGRCCFLGGNNLGWTYPSGDIVLHVGQPLELFCTINLENAKAENFTVDDLVFQNDGQIVDQRYITKINETTIRLYLENQQESSHIYSCNLVAGRTNKTSLTPIPSISSLEVPTSAFPEDLKNVLICMNIVAVGKEPKEAENLTCVSIDWDSLQCSWNVPKNYVETKYTIRYVPTRRSERQTYGCPNDDDIKHNNCTWTAFTEPIYRKRYPDLKIIVTGQNVYGKTEHIRQFNHFAHVLPSAPKSLSIVNKTTTSILLVWDIKDLCYFPKTWIYKILYTFDGTNWSTLIYSPKSNDKNLIKYNVTNLIPYTLYNFRVQMKSEIASDSYWSKDFAAIVCRTKASVPPHPPITDIGSFQIEYGSRGLMRFVYIYWQPLLLSENYGDKFHYEIEVMPLNNNNDTNGNKEKSTTDKQISVNNSYAKYEIGMTSYQFSIRSANSEGVSSNASVIIVPSSDNVVEPCSNFQKIDHGNSIYELSWDPPKQEKYEITNYTAFWCQTEKEQPYQCDGFIEWKHLPASITKHTFSIKTSNSYQFAISANTAYSSSGMLWAKCTVLAGQLGTIKYMHAVNVGSTYLNLDWKLECLDQSTTIIGFLVDYCEASSRNDTKCLGPELNTTWYGNAQRNTGNLTDLKPYTYYRVSIRMFTSGKEGAPSSPSIFRTLEGAPKVDGLNVTLLNRSNTTATIDCDIPSVVNNSTLYYNVTYYVEDDPNNIKNFRVYKQPFTIMKLDAYVKYCVSVEACTTECSKYEKEVKFQTRIGTPGQPSVEPITNVKGSEAEVWWNPPALMAGPNPQYELVVIRDGISDPPRNVSNRTHTTISVPDCNGDKTSLYAFQVRAVNVERSESDESVELRLVGNWSSIFHQTCAINGLSTAWKVLACIVFPLFFAIVFFYGGRKGFYKWKDMKSVQVNIPMKFIVPTESSDAKKPHYTTVPSCRSPDECSNLVDKSTENTY